MNKEINPFMFIPLMLIAYWVIIILFVNYNESIQYRILRYTGIVQFNWYYTQCNASVSKLHTETVPAQHNTRHKANGRQTDGR